MTDQEAYDELAYYTLSHGDPAFIHQYVVDAYAAQHATEASKPIYLAFALAGLYLHNEKNFSGKQVQRAHMRLAKNKSTLPIFKLPSERGKMSVVDVAATAPGTLRDTAIEQWSASVWEAYHGSEDKVSAWVDHELGLNTFRRLGKREKSRKGRHGAGGSQIP